MKKRLRKKKRIAEFQEFSFKAGFRFSDRLTLQARNELLVRFIEVAIEKNGLQYGGGGAGNEWNGFVALSKPRGSTLESHRRAVKRCFIHEAQIHEYYISTMINAWHFNLDDAKINWKKKLMISSILSLGVEVMLSVAF